MEKTESVLNKLLLIIMTLITSLIEYILDHMVVFILVLYVGQNFFRHFCSSTALPFGVEAHI